MSAGSTVPPSASKGKAKAEEPEHVEEDTGSDASSFDEEDDQDWGDWVDDDEEVFGVAGKGASTLDGFKVPTLALFPDTQGSSSLETFPDALSALEHAKALGCDFVSVVKRLNLDPLQVIRALNHLRRNPGKLSPEAVAKLQGNESFLDDDEELMPVKGAETDGLLQIDFDELIQAAEAQQGKDKKTADYPRKKIEELESQLLALQLAYSDLQKRSLATLGLSEQKDAGESSKSTKQSAYAIASNQMQAAPERDDDTHYFESYAGHDIHQIMISDTSRTYSYAKFIMSPHNAHLFRGKRIMDIGCGSGILSLFAARAGAKEVIAIDASDVAHRAEANIRENKMDHVVKVVKGKVENLKEELKLYEGKIDVIISEWMGYFLLYESMLPSVLHARDLYLRKEVTPENPQQGLLAPSHCRMTLAAVSDSELLHERIHFWNDVHGFKMSAMTKGLFDDAYTESLKAEAVVSDVADIFDLPLCVLPAQQPTFRSPFKLTCKKDAEVHGFVSWFDTWFMTTPEPYKKDANGAVVQLQGGEVLSELPPCRVDELKREEVPGLALRGNEIMSAEAGAAKGEEVSFTTSPFGKETHWKQTVFLLKEPLQAKQGDTISGEIVVLQSESNSRELDVELHYLLEDAPVQGRRGSRVQARIAQIFRVR